MSRIHALLPIFLIFMFGMPLSVDAGWQPAGKLSLPEYSFVFLATSPQGNLLVTTFNNSATGKPPSEIPALMIKNPSSGNPEVKELCKVAFSPQRGYSGLACDEAGFFFVSGDTGEAASCFLRKFRPDGSPDTSFGEKGMVIPNRRCLGIDVVGNYLLLAVDWGQIQVYNASTGQLIGSTPVPEETLYVRDIAVDPTSMRIFGVAAGGVIAWDGGSPWEPSKYRYKILTASTGEIRAGEGISYDPIIRAAVVSPVPGNKMYEVVEADKIMQTIITSAKPDTHLADSALSFDGKMLFITDMISREIHILKRSLTDDLIEITPSGISDTKRQVPKTSTPEPTRPVSSPEYVHWYKSYTRIVEQARRERKPMLLYFRRAGVEKCEDFEKNVLLKPSFNSLAGSYVCVFEDIRHQTLMAYRLGVFRVPQLTLLGPSGNVFARFTYDIDQHELFNAMEALK